VNFVHLRTSKLLSTLQKILQNLYILKFPPSKMFLKINSLQKINLFSPFLYQRKRPSGDKLCDNFIDYPGSQSLKEKKYFLGTEWYLFPAPLHLLKDYVCQITHTHTHTHTHPSAKDSSYPIPTRPLIQRTCL
jgi:hypothetical protein